MSVGNSWTNEDGEDVSDGKLKRVRIDTRHGCGGFETMMDLVDCSIKEGRTMKQNMHRIKPKFRDDGMNRHID